MSNLHKTVPQNGKPILYFLSLWLLLSIFWAFVSLILVHQIIGLGNHWLRETTIGMLQPPLEHVIIDDDYRDLQKQLQQLREKKAIEYYAAYVQYPDTLVNFASSANAPEDRRLLYFPIRFTQKQNSIKALVSILPRQMSSSAFISNHLLAIILLLIAAGFFAAFFLYFLYYFWGIKALRQLADTIKQSFPDISKIELGEQPKGILSVMSPSVPQLKNAIKELAQLLNSYRQKEQTARKQLSESEENYRRITETARDIIVVFDMKGRIVYVNEAGLQMAGYTREEAVNKKITNFIPQEYEKEFKEKIAKRLNGDRQKYLYELEFLTSNGEHVPVEVSSSPIVHDGKINRILIIARDISARKKAEKELAVYRQHLQDLIEKRTAQLEEKNRELEKMNELFIGREFRIKELKDKVKILTEQIQRLKQKLES